MTRLLTRTLLLCLVTALPLHGRTIDLKESMWEVRTKPGAPGTGCWSSGEDAVRVERGDLIRLRLHKVGQTWCQTQVASRTPARYGRHRFQVVSRLDLLHASAVLGLFLYRDDEREIDIEISRQFGGVDDVGIYTLQPSTRERSHTFPIDLTGSYTTHEIEWLPDSVRFASWHGHCDEGPCGGWISRWTFVGERIPFEEDELRVMMNLWLRGREEPDEEQSVLLRYSFHPTSQ